MTDDWGGGNVHISAIVEHGKAYFIMNTPGTPHQQQLRIALTTVRVEGSRLGNEEGR